MTQNTKQVRPCPRWTAILLALAICPKVSAAEKTVAATDQKTGTIEGIITYQPDPKRPWRYARYYVKNNKTGELAEAVVALSGPSINNKIPPPPKPNTVVVDQKNFMFIPETTAIRAGDRIKFLNSDQQVHNVMAFQRTQSFNVNMPAGESHIETFKDATGLKLPYRLGCVYHSAMRAWIFVLDHPYFQLTGQDGKFRLQNDPPGKHKLAMVHPASNLRWTQEVIVTPGETTHVAIRVSPDNKPKKRTRKKGAKP